MRRLRRDRNWCRSRRRALRGRRRGVSRRPGKRRMHAVRKRKAARDRAAKESRGECGRNLAVRRAQTLDFPRQASGKFDRLRFITEYYDLLRLLTSCHRMVRRASAVSWGNFRGSERKLFEEGVDVGAASGAGRGSEAVGGGAGGGEAKSFVRGGIALEALS